MAEHEEHKEGHEEGGHGGGGHGGGGHGGGGHAEGEHEGAPEWLISFADNVALMMGFFVILLAMNMQKPKPGGGIGGDPKSAGSPTTQMLDFVIAMRKEFNNPIDLNSDNPAEAPLRRRIRELKAAGDSNNIADPGPGKEAHALQSSELTNLGGTIQFEDGSSSLSDKNRNAVRAIALRMEGHRFVIEVRGHVSPHEALKGADQAYGLAFARATTIAKELTAAGIPQEQLRLSACGANERKTSRDDSYIAELDAQNQRVEIIMTGEPIRGNSAPNLPKKEEGAETTPSGEEISASSHRD